MQLAKHLALDTSIPLINLLVEYLANLTDTEPDTKDVVKATFREMTEEGLIARSPFKDSAEGVTGYSAIDFIERVWWDPAARNLFGVVLVRRCVLMCQRQSDAEASLLILEHLAEKLQLSGADGSCDLDGDDRFYDFEKLILAGEADSERYLEIKSKISMKASATVRF